MMIVRSLFRFATSTFGSGTVAVALSFGCAAASAQDDFAAAVTATHPLAYFRLDAATGKSMVGAATYKAVGSATAAAPGAPTGDAANKSLKLDGKTGYVTTTQMGGVSTTASIMAWINLADLPSKQAHYFYVAGESQSGNDLDLQFETDNHVRFFTAGGGNVDYAPPVSTLVGQWHMVVATLDTVSKVRAMYWDGKQVATDHGGGSNNKASVFTIGESPLFTGRHFSGQVQDAALWNRALKPAEVAAIYATAGNASGTTATAGSSSAGAGMFPTKAKVEIDDSKGHLQLKRPEQIAIMFLTAIEGLEANCDSNGKRACTWDQLLTKLKYDPRTDPNYTYTVFASGTAWEAHATAKKAGLTGFAFFARSWPGSTLATFNPSGTSGYVDTELQARSVDGDSFAIY
jgi:Concanavalin A-like lectin/glucanases superfamily